MPVAASVSPTSSPTSAEAAGGPPPLHAASATEAHPQDSTTRAGALREANVRVIAFIRLPAPDATAIVVVGRCRVLLAA
jgi:hypothetical protein